MQFHCWESCRSTAEKKKRRRCRSSENWKLDRFIPQHSSAPIINLTKEGLVIQMEHLTIGNKIGVGSWGVVCKGDYYLGTETAEAPQQCYPHGCMQTSEPTSECDELCSWMQSQSRNFSTFTCAKQIARVLAYMHSRDPIVIHQDLKPANVMVSWGYHAYVCDLGVAKPQKHLATIKTSKGSGAGLRLIKHWRCLWMPNDHGKLIIQMHAD
ncbi:hypothetical protein EMCRGX_G026222 [Ephydatia muelleri]